MADNKSHLRLVDDTDNFSQNVWSKDNMVVAHRHALFPDNCIICNQPAKGISVKKMVFWHTPMLLPVLLLSLPFYVIFALVFKRTLRLDIPLCPKHFWQRRIVSSVGLGLMPVAFWMVYIAMSTSKPPLILSGILSVIVGALLAGWALNPIWATRIRGDYAVIKGVHSDLVNELPTWKGEDL